MENEEEQDLWLEFEKFEQVLNGKEIPTEYVDLESTLPRKGRKSYSAYEFAEAEGEKEILEDKLHELLSKTDEYNGKLMSLNASNMELASKNEKLARENDSLKAELEALKKMKNNVCSENSEERFRLIEFKLAETRSKLARTLQTFDDLTLAKDFALKELEQEKLMRIHVEKERDAYCAAYEASLTHFDRWTNKAKAQQQRSGNGSAKNDNG